MQLRLRTYLRAKCNTMKKSLLWFNWEIWSRFLVSSAINVVKVHWSFENAARYKTASVKIHLERMRKTAILSWSFTHRLFSTKANFPWETEFQNVSLALLSVTEICSHNWTQAKIPVFYRCFFISQLFSQQPCFRMVWLTLALQINKGFKVSGVCLSSFLAFY